MTPGKQSPSVPAIGPRTRSDSVLDLNRRGVALTAYSVVAYLVCFWRLGSNGIIQMEGMVADGARHMVESGQWLVPRVYGEIYTYKPALAYWLGAIAYAVTEQPSEGLLRLPFAASIFVMGLVVFYLIDRLAGSRVAAICAIASVSGGIVVEKVRLAEFDGILTAGVGVAIVAACHNLAAPKARPGIWLLGYLGLTFAFLAKGVPALMFYGPGVLAAAWATRRFRRLTEWHHVAAAMLFVAMTAGYLGTAYHESGADVFLQPLAESRVRGFGWLGGSREAPTASEFVLSKDEAEVTSKPLLTVGRTLAKPALILLAFLPWSLLVPFAISRKSLASEQPQIRSLARGAGAFVAAGALVFMAVPTHAMRYYMPLSAAVAILAGISATSRWAGDPAGRRKELSLVAAFAVLVASLTVAAGLLLETPPIGLLGRFAITAVGSLALLLIAGVFRSRDREPLPKLLVLTALCMVVTLTLGIGGRHASRRNLEPQARAIENLLPDNEPLWILGPSDRAGKSSSLYFYLHRPVRSFQPDGALPPDGSYCLLPTDRMGDFERISELAFVPITRVEHIWRDYRLGRCRRVAE